MREERKLKLLGCKSQREAVRTAHLFNSENFNWTSCICSLDRKTFQYLVSNVPMMTKQHLQELITHLAQLEIPALISLQLQFGVTETVLI